MLSISWGFISTILFSGTFYGHFAVMKAEAAAVGLAAAVLCEHDLVFYHIIKLLQVAPQEIVFLRLWRFHSDDVQLPHEPDSLLILSAERQNP